MSITLRLTFRGLDASDALADYARFRAVDLVREHPRVERIQVVIDATNECQGIGGPFRASVSTNAASVDGLTRLAGHDHPGAALDAAFAETDRLLAAQTERRGPPRGRTNARLDAFRKARSAEPAGWGMPPVGRGAP